MSQQPPSQDPGAYGQPSGAPRQPGFSQPGYPNFPTYSTAPRPSLDMAKLIFIAGWVVLALYGLVFFYYVADGPDTGADFADLLFSSMERLGVGIFQAGILLAVSRWLEKQKQTP